MDYKDTSNTPDVRSVATSQQAGDDNDITNIKNLIFPQFQQIVEQIKLCRGKHI